MELAARKSLKPRLNRTDTMGETRLILLRLIKRQRHKENVATVLNDLIQDPDLGAELKRWAK